MASLYIVLEQGNKKVPPLSADPRRQLIKGVLEPIDWPQEVTRRPCQNNSLVDSQAGDAKQRQFNGKCCDGLTESLSV